MPPLKKIEFRPIGFVKRTSSNKDVTDRSLISKIILKKDLTKALEGIEDFSHVFVIFWLHKISNTEKTTLQDYQFPPKDKESSVGIFATRAPIRPNLIGLTLVELVKRIKNVLWVRGLDTFDDTPVLDIKPYPDWECGRWQVIVNFRVPKWLSKINKPAKILELQASPTNLRIIERAYSKSSSLLLLGEHFP